MQVIDTNLEKFGFYNITVAVYDFLAGYKILDSAEIPIFVKVKYLFLIKWYDNQEYALFDSVYQQKNHSLSEGMAKKDAIITSDLHEFNTKIEFLMAT